MTISKTQWKTIQKVVPQIERVPEWIQSMALWPYQKIIELPRYNGMASQCVAQPTFGFVLVKQDYLDFLAQQIEIEPRGPKWAEVLKKRMLFLRNMVGAELVAVHFYRGQDYGWFYLEQESDRVLYSEFE